MISDPAPPTPADLDRLSDACRAAPEEIAPQVALWEAVAALEQWFFVNRGSDDAPQPYAVAAPAGPMVCVFSSADRAAASARESGLVGAEDAVPLFSVPLPQALDWVASLAQGGVAGVVVDHPTIGAWTPLANLARLPRASS